MANALGIDFGTSNTAAAILTGNAPWVIPLEEGRDTLPTAVFFDARAKGMMIGHEAVAALVNGREGRFMRSLKSVLGTPLLREKRQFGQDRMTLVEVIARFLAEVKARAEARCRTRFDIAQSGRPVHFHSRDPGRDAQALVDLTECYRLAGFDDVRFLFEPEAAALAYGGAGGELSLIVDIGGGTSDFSLFRGGERTSILASHGVRIGGTDFDNTLSLSHVMPLLGKDSEIRAVFGPATHTAPVAMYHDLATWATIPFLYNGETRRAVAQMGRLAVQPELFRRLATVLEMELGHDLAFAVERGKIAANKDATGVIDLRLVEAGLAKRLTAADLAHDLAGYAGEIRDAAERTCAIAGIGPEAVERIVLVGGSSLMAIVEQTMKDAFPAAELAYTNAFTAVVDGLAIAAARD